MSKLHSIQSLVRQGPGPRDKDREALRIAIEHADVTRRALEASKNSVARAMRHQDSCSDLLEQATASVAAAKAARADRLAAAAASGEAVTSDRGLLDARAFEVAATDELEAAGIALLTCQQGIEGNSEALKVAERMVSELSRAILARHIEPVIADIRRQRDALFDSLSTLHFLKNSCVELWPPSSEESRLRSHLQIPARNGVVFEIDYEANQGASSKWSRYAEELKISADAEPPSI